MPTGTAFELLKSRMKNLMKMSHNITKLLLSGSSLKAVVIVMMAFSFSGCSEFLRGKPKAQDYIEVKNNNLGCLDNLSEDMKKFLDAEASEQDLDNSMICITNILTEFQVKVEGRADKNAFTAFEIYDMFRVFAPEAGLSEAAANNMVHLKSALIGGDKTRITKPEITELIKYLGLVKEEAKKLLPYIKVYYMEETNKQYSQAFIREAFSKLNLTLKRLLNASKLSNSGYKFEDFKSMLVNMLNLAGDEKNMVEIMAKINYVLNGYQLELSDSERAQYIDNLTEFLRLYSMYSNGYVKIDFENLDDLDSNIEFIHEAINLLEKSLQYTKTSLISANSIDRLLIEIANSNLLNPKVRASSLISIYKTVMTRLFESGLNGNILNYTGIKPVNFIHLKREIAVFQIYSRLIKRTITQDSINAGLTHYNIRELQRVISGLNINNEVDILGRFDANNQYQINSIVNELRNQFLDANPVLYHNKKAGLALNQDQWSQTRGDLAKGLYIKMFSRWIMMGYATPFQVMGVTNLTLNDVSMYLWYSEFKAFMIDIKNFDPRTFNSGTALVKAGNLFTRSGNGDNILNFKEFHEIMATQLSGGGPLYKEIEDDLLAARCDLPELDVFNKNWKIESCFDQVVRANYRKYYSALPHLIAYLETLTDVQFKQYFRELLNIARYDQGLAGQRIETSDINTMNSMVHFIESVYLVHDTNRNWFLSESEIRTAYPKFKSIATEFAETTARADIEKFTSWMGDVGGYGCFSREDLIEESFIFLAYNGRTPNQSDFNSFPCFLGKPLLNFSGEINRHRLTATFKSLKDVIAP